MCGFRSLDQILKNISSSLDICVPDIIPQNLYDELLTINKSINNKKNQEILLQKIWSHLYTLTPTQCEDIIKKFQNKYKNVENLYQEQIQQNIIPNWDDFTTSTGALIWELSKKYPSDIAVFSPIFLHYFALQPGESIFLGPNIPHAYLYGDCAEIMACSDNVIRAGLTPKYRDVDTLLTSLTYDTNAAPLINHGLPLETVYTRALPEDFFSDVTLKTSDIITQYDDSIVKHRVYQPPLDEFPEFMIVETSFNKSFIFAQLPVIESKSLLLVQKGSAYIIIGDFHLTNKQTFKLTAGNTIYIPANSLVFVISCDDNTLIHRSAANQEF